MPYHHSWMRQDRMAVRFHWASGIRRLPECSCVVNAMWMSHTKVLAASQSYVVYVGDASKQ